MRLLRYGDSAVLVELEPPTDAAPGSAAALRELLAGRDGIGAVVPGARTLLVEYDASRWTVDALAAALDARRLPDEQDPPAQVEIPVRYDGADLREVARLTGVDETEVVGLHTGATYTVAFCGFSPGFAYLTGLPNELHVPRLATPRTTVPAGAVAIAGEYAAVYPSASPGGWRLLGTTELTMWAAERERPALLTPGTAVRFVAT